MPKNKLKIQVEYLPNPNFEEDWTQMVEEILKLAEEKNEEAKIAN